MNAVLPGSIETEGLAELGDETLAQMTASIPAGRLGSAEDVVDGGQVLPESLAALEVR